MDYRLHDQLISPARPSSELWRVVAGACLIVLMYIVLGMVMMSALSGVIGELGYSVFTTEMENGTTPRGMLAQLFGIGLLTIPVLLVTMSLHQRSPLGLFGPPAQAWRAFVRVTLAACATLVLIWALPPSEFLIPLERAQEIGPWLSLLVISLLAVLVQVTAEELVFRGYLQQQLAARFDHWLVWMVVPSALFALMHYSSEFGPNAWLIVGWAFAFGCAAADLTARSGTLGAAIALHFVQNVGSLLVVALVGKFDALALYHMPLSLTDTAAVRPMILIECVVLFCLWVTARIALRR